MSVMRQRALESGLFNDACCCAIAVIFSFLPTELALPSRRKQEEIDIVAQPSRMRRGAVSFVILLLLAAKSPAFFAPAVGQAHAGSIVAVGVSSPLRVVDSQPAIMHFNLLGPDWARIPEGYSGLTPMKVVAELNIPEEYVTQYRPLTENESSIPIVVAYPSMKGATKAPFSEPHIYVGIDAHREDKSRKGVRFLFEEAMKHNLQLDVDGLCGYVDNEHPGNAGLEFYGSCDEAERTFFITCFQPFNNRRSCSETAFLEGEIGAELTYQYSMLKDHQVMLDALRKLVMSFAQPGAEK